MDRGAVLARRASKIPTELELEILKILWRDGKSTVRHVRDELALTRDLAHTTVITTMKVMIEKGYLERSKEEKKFLYSPTLPREEVEGKVVGDVVGRVFDGSPLALMLNILDQAEIQKSDLDNLREYIEQKSQEVGE
ncbi:MAG: BlaI/MecI/CopY family transcriptional regulator [Candidatus Omnitrophica bacterium]|nr:BlaI/MecI/CopY family transcriptional regulator [Candidatus Omnitrophota bacterium]